MQSPSRRLIVNADDLGVAPGVTRGILELAARGIVTSTSVITNMPASAAAVSAARAAQLDMGLHLNVSAGRPLCRPDEIPSLVQADGRFISFYGLLRRRLRGQLRLGDLLREWTAQLEWCLAAGLTPSHLDTHCHVHAFSGLYGTLVGLARRYRIQAVRRALAGYVVGLPGHRALGRAQPHGPQPAGRPASTDHFSVLTGRPAARSARALSAVLAGLPPGLHELVCHPGYVDEALRAVDPLTAPREREMRLLCDPLVRDTLAAHDIRLVSWADAVAR